MNPCGLQNLLSGRSKTRRLSASTNNADWIPPALKKAVLLVRPICKEVSAETWGLMSLWQCILCRLNVLKLFVCVHFSLCLWWLCFRQTAVGVMQSSLQFNLLLITDKMSPKHPERMRKYRAAAELFKGKVSPNREEGEPLRGQIKGQQWFLLWMGRA